jgi:hypothetical protein
LGRTFRGFIAGSILALVYKTKEYTKVIKYEWEHPDFNPAQDRFMQRFDENGNFVIYQLRKSLFFLIFE